MFDIKLLLIAEVWQPKSIASAFSFSINIWDTAGGEDYARLRPLSYPETDVCLICMNIYDNRIYSMDKNKYYTNRQVNTMALCQEIKAFNKDIPRILVGMKTDLRNDKDINIRNKCWSTEEMQNFSLLFECNHYIECSSLKYDNLDNVFDLAIKCAMKYTDYTKNTKNKSNCILM